MRKPKHYLTVGKLKQELEKYDNDLPVMIYAHEDGGLAYSVRSEPDVELNMVLVYQMKYPNTKLDELLYFKGDHPFSYTKDDKGNKIIEAVVIKGA